jgi:hypothetical protein
MNEIEGNTIGELVEGQVVYKYKIFPEDLIIRSGDDFAIFLKNLSIEDAKTMFSHCYNVDENGYSAKKNKLFTVSVCI